MTFVQTLSFTCHDEDGLIALMQDWGEESVGAIGFWQAVIMKDRDEPDAYTIWVEFSSYEEAMQNSNRPQTDAYAKRLATLVDGGVRYTNYDLIAGEGSALRGRSV